MTTDWKECKLGKISEVLSSKRIYAADYVPEGIPFYRSKEIIQKSLGQEIDETLYISVEKFNSIKNEYGAPSENDILISAVGERSGIPYLVRNETFYFKDGNLIWLRNFDETNIDSRFLCYWFKSKVGQASLNNLMIGSAQRALTIIGIKSISILLPPLEIQQKIVRVLGAIDEKIELNNSLNNNLEQQAMALYENLITENEENLQEVSLSDIANITMGQSPDGSSYNEDGIGTVFYQGRAEFGFRYPTRRLYTTEPKRMAHYNDVLMSVRAPVGDINVAFEDCCIGRGLAAIQSKNKTPSFILYTMFNLKKDLNIFNGEGTIFGSINKDSLNSLKLNIPLDDKILKFEKNVAPLDKLIETNCSENQRLIKLRDTLLPRLMNGEIDVDKVEV